MLTREDVERLIKAYEAKDLDGVLAEFADNAYVYDQHYPQTDIVGKKTIRPGLDWALGNMEQPEFTIRPH